VCSTWRAGLDTFGLRNPHASLGVRVFEVDNPATQAWKRERLKHAGLANPASLIFVPVDFERQSLADDLATAGFHANRAAFFQWLGVVPYLTREAVSLTLDFIAGVPESEVVFDYGEPFENYRADRRADVIAIVEDLGLAELTERFYGALKQGIVIGPGGHVVRAQR
jgi:methyltransferase (TIGR00027 family)